MKLRVLRSSFERNHSLWRDMLFQCMGPKGTACDTQESHDRGNKQPVFHALAVTLW